MAGLLQGKTTAIRRNDTAPLTDIQEVTTQRSPIYIPVAEFADGDIETAESQHIGNFFFYHEYFIYLLNFSFHMVIRFSCSSGESQ